MPVQMTQQILVRPTVLTLMLLAQLMVISLGFDAYQPEIAASGEWYSFLSGAGQFAKVLVAIPVFIVLGLWPRLPRHLETLNRSISEDPRYILIIAQVLSFGLFAWCTAAIFGEQVGIDEISDGLVLAWFATLASTAVLWLLALAPASYWRGLMFKESAVLLAALAVGVVAWLLARYAQSLWTPLSDMTFHLSATLLDMIYADILVDPETKRLGAQDFIVSIAPQCSGYEGMGLMAIFTGFYLSVFRNDFRFPQALWLFPIGLVTIWLFNNLRIAVLIAIGASFSPAVAIGGFHSQAGWISFIAVIVLTLSLAYRMPFFSTVPATASAAKGLNLPMALLIPFIVLLAATIVTSALSADFDWLYPLRVLAVGLALAYCWRLYGLTRPRFRWESWVAGLVVFVIWILLVPVDSARDQVFDASLQEASTAVAAGWLLLRTVGAVVTVPLAEELLFRGYLLSRLADREIRLEGRLEISWIALAVSSLLFGLLHADWVAGVAAGLVYGLVRYRSDSVKDAVIAHAATNALLTAYVLSTGHWSLW